MATGQQATSPSWAYSPMHFYTTAASAAHGAIGMLAWSTFSRFANANTESLGHSYAKATPTATATATATASGTPTATASATATGTVTATLHQRSSTYANTAPSANTSASSIAPVAVSLPATPKLREGGGEAQSRTIVSAVDARLTETRLTAPFYWNGGISAPLRHSATIEIPIGSLIIIA